MHSGNPAVRGRGQLAVLGSRVSQPGVVFSSAGSRWECVKSSAQGLQTGRNFSFLHSLVRL